MRAAASSSADVYWGDNVVREPDEPEGAEPFYRAIAADTGDYDLAAFVTVSRSPEEFASAS